MRLFGLPYQFNSSVDPILPDISSSAGRKFVENIILDAPVITIIPGGPDYLPGSKSKKTRSQALLSAASESFSSLKEIIDSESNTNESFKYYDFKQAYTEYMQYVNVLCRSCASFLEINEKIDGVDCRKYDYSRYKWDENYTGSDSQVINILKSAHGAINNITGLDINYTATNKDDKKLSLTDDVLEAEGYSYVQFYIDADSFTESISNSTGESQVKGMIDQGSALLKEVHFLAQSGGMSAEEIDEFVEGTANTLKTTLNSVSGGNGVLSRVINLSGQVLQGENIIMPDIYQNSSYDKQYSFTVHLKSPYGSKFGYFMDICVPLMHLLCLALPKQTTANTYGSPFLVKAYCQGIFNCNLGLVTGISISKGINSAYSVDGLPTEVDVSITIADLYTDLSMTPSTDPLLFINNSSLIEYLATTCGLSLIAPNLKKRIGLIADVLTSSITDIPTNVQSSIAEAVDNAFADFLRLW